MTQKRRGACRKCPLRYFNYRTLSSNLSTEIEIFLLLTSAILATSSTRRYAFAAESAADRLDAEPRASIASEPLKAIGHTRCTLG